MKGHVLAPSFVLLAALGACASPGRPEPMPSWSPELVATRPAAAPSVARSDNDDVRIPREESQPDIWPARGTYLGIALITSQPNEDFDGKTIYSSGNSELLIPDVDVGAGGGLYLGQRWHMNELVIQYSITDHNGKFNGTGLDHDTKFYDLDFNWRRYFLEHSALQPYTLLGLGISRAKTDNGSRDLSTVPITYGDGEAKDGISLNVGLGAALYTLPWVSFWGQAMYRFVRYKAADGIVAGNGPADPDIIGNGWNVSFGASIRLIPARKKRHVDPELR